MEHKTRTGAKEKKELLTTGPILSCPDFNHPFQLETDASDTG